MQITFSLESFQKRFGLVASVVNPRNPKEILQHVLLTATKEDIRLQATDGDISIVAKIDGNVTQPGTVLLPASLVSKIIAEATFEQLEIYESKNVLKIECGPNSEFDLPTADPHEFPSHNYEELAAYCEVPRRVLLECIKRTVFATDPDSSRYALGGMLFQVADGELQVVGTDGRRLANVSSKGECVGRFSTDGFTPILPQRYASVAQKALGGDGNVKFTFTSNDAYFDTGDCTMRGRLIEGRFPNWRQVIPRVESDYQKIYIAAGQLFSAIRQASITVDTETRGLDFEFSKGKLVITGSSSGTGKSNIEMPINYDGDTIVTKLDHRYVADFLRVSDPSVLVTLHVKDSNASVLFEVDSYRYVVMPMALER